MTTSFTVEIDDYETANLMDNTRSGIYKQINGKIEMPTEEINGLNDHSGIIGELLRDDNDEVIQDAGFRTAFNFVGFSGNLVSESVNTSVDGLLTINLEFKNYLK